MIVGGTGHRTERILECKGSVSAIRNELDRWIQIHPELVLFRSGGARGWDLMFGEAALRAGRKVEVLLPFPVEIHTAKWYDPEDFLTLEKLLDNATEVRYASVNPVYDPRMYHVRDRMIVDGAQRILALWDLVDGGGTHSTIMYARSLGIPVDVISPGHK